MSKKQLLSESEIRRFMKLANLQPLANNVIVESDSSMQQEGSLEEEAPMGNDSGDQMMTPDAGLPSDDEAEEGGMEVEIADETSPEKKDTFEQIVNAIADVMGIEVELESQEEQEEEGGEEKMPDMETDKDSGEEDEGEGETEQEYELEETESSQTLSEDELVETVLNRVTARLVAEAKKSKMSIKEKMKLKAQKGKEGKEGKEGKKGKEGEEVKEYSKSKKQKVEEATDAKGGGPLLSKGGNKHDIYKGHADMAYAKGKEGKGGHQMEVLPAKAEHTVTHGGKNLATLGGNKKKV